MDIAAIRTGTVKTLAGVNLNDQDLANAVLERVNLAGASLVGVDLSHACLKGSRLDG
ncbi:MAG: pentapeptide repeat-containing protein, partial [Spirulina sp. DLM2.Bin59]